MRTFAIATLVGFVSAETLTLQADGTSHLVDVHYVAAGAADVRETDFTGAGYLDFGSLPGKQDNGGTAQWDFTAQKAGAYRICARYTGNLKKAEILINGKQETNYPMTGTGDYTTWREACKVMDIKKGATSLTLRSPEPKGTALVDNLALEYLGYVPNDKVASAAEPLTTVGQPQEHWKGDRPNPTTQTDTYKIGRDQPCNDDTCPMEKLPVGLDGNPTSAFPRMQTHIAHTLTRSGVTVRVSANPAGNAGGRWNDALSDTITSKGTFNAQHVFEPQQSNNYNPHVQKACCMDKCQGKTGCEFGCGTWLAKSSLNWEGSHWFDALAKKCAKDCMAKRLATSSPNYAGNSVYEETHYDSLTKDSEKGCVTGCQKFRTCMNQVQST
jgi:hypothetical protein